MDEQCLILCNVFHTSFLFLFLSLNTISWSRNAIKMVLKTERAVFPGTLFKGWVKRHPNEEWQRYPARGQLPHSPCFSELNKSAQGSSVILCVAAGGDLSVSDKGSVLVNVGFHPRRGIYENWWHCVCSLPSYTTECKGLHNKTIHCVHTINFYPRGCRSDTNGAAHIYLQMCKRTCSKETTGVTVVYSSSLKFLNGAIHKAYSRVLIHCQYTYM